MLEPFSGLSHSPKASSADCAEAGPHASIRAASTHPAVAAKLLITGYLALPVQQTRAAGRSCAPAVPVFLARNCGVCGAARLVSCLRIADHIAARSDGNSETKGH